MSCVGGTVFLVAECSAARFAEVTGLSEGKGFVLHGDRRLPGGIYPDSMGEQIAYALRKAHIGHHPTWVQTVNEGRRRLAKVLDYPNEAHREARA